MVTTLSIHKGGPLAAEYPAAHAKIMRHLAAFHDKLISSELLNDLELYLIRVASPDLGVALDIDMFDRALEAYDDVRDVIEGNHRELHVNRSGTVNNTLELLDREQDYLDFIIRDLLNKAGIR